MPLLNISVPPFPTIPNIVGIGLPSINLPALSLGGAISVGGVSLGGSIGVGGISVGGSLSVGGLSIGLSGGLGGLSGGLSLSLPGILSGDGPGIGPAFGGPPQWGIYDSNYVPVIQADTIVEVEYRNDYRISSAPQEQGAFMSYNKVSEPFIGHVTFAQGGDADDRGEFLSSIAAAQQSLALYSLVMPDYVYPSLNITHYDFKRTQRSGISMLIVDVGFEEVRITGTTQYSTTATPSGQDEVQGGSTQAANPTPSQTSTVEPAAHQSADGSLTANSNTGAPAGGGATAGGTATASSPASAAASTPSGGGGGSSSTNLYSTAPSAPLPAVPTSPSAFPPGGGESAAQAAQAGQQQGASQL